VATIDRPGFWHQSETRGFTSCNAKNALEQG
jgi:hypothetical protein